jgi:hypothetical protein
MIVITKYFSNKKGTSFGYSVWISSRSHHSQILQNVTSELWLAFFCEARSKNTEHLFSRFAISAIGISGNCPGCFLELV